MPELLDALLQRLAAQTGAVRKRWIAQNYEVSVPIDFWFSLEIGRDKGPWECDYKEADVMAHAPEWAISAHGVTPLTTAQSLEAELKRRYG